MHVSALKSSRAVVISAGMRDWVLFYAGDRADRGVSAWRAEPEMVIRMK